MNSSGRPGGLSLYIGLIGLKRFTIVVIKKTSDAGMSNQNKQSRNTWLQLRRIERVTKQTFQKNMLTIQKTSNDRLFHSPDRIKIA